MKTKILKISLLFLLVLPALISAQISGTKTIGATGNYSTIQSAFNNINSLGLAGAVILEIQTDYNSAGESYPILPGALTGNSEINTVTLRPALGVSNIVLESNASHTIDFNSTKHFILDGRPGGFGSSQEITISNSNPTANTIRFINESSYNEIRYCRLKGDEAKPIGNTEYGVVNIGTSTGGIGNNNIFINNCDIFNYSSGASRLIYIGGSPGINNDSISVTNCRLYNFVNRAIETSSDGVGSRMIISGNSIFEPSDLINDSVTSYAILVMSGDNHLITGNFIGGKEINCGGLPLTSISAFTAISVTVGDSNSSAIQGNVIRNLNLIGPGSSFKGIEVLSGSAVISSNTIGSDTSSNSILTSGILSSTAIVVSGSGNIEISENLIANLNASGSAASNGIRGIISFIGTGDRNISNNRIHNLSTAASNTISSNLNASVVGIGTSSPNPSQKIKHNTIYSLGNYRTAGTSTSVLAIVVTSGGGKISENKIYDITNTCTGSSSTIAGIFGTNGDWSVINNQLSLTNGSNTNSVVIRGIRPRITSSSVLWKIYYNSVYIGGNAVIGTHQSSCISKELGNILDIKNNIFYNSRTGGTGKHYSLDFTNNTGITSEYNLIVGPNSNLTKWGVSDYNFTNYKLNSGCDLFSYSNQPINIPSSILFVNTSAGNLNIISSGSEAFYLDGKGIAVAGISGDFNDTIGIRNTSVSQGVTDIGSDEFTYSGPIPELTASGVPALNTTTIYTFGGREICLVDWSGIGTVPSSVSIKYYSGYDPPGTLNGQYSKAYWQATATGGSGYTYGISLNYSPAVLYNISDENNLKLSKYDEIWKYAADASVNISMKTVSKTGENSFTTFALTSSDDPLNQTLGLQLTSLIQGLYDNTINKTVKDTISVYLRNAGSPFEIIDSSKGFFDSTGVVNLSFQNAPGGTYYLELKQRNSIQTWSSFPITFGGMTDYDFTTSNTKAYGNNQILKGSRYCIYSGDVNQDGTIDLTDLVMIFNNSAAFITGYVDTDLNGDSIVDLTDLNIAYNNSIKFIVTHNPLVVLK